VAGRGGSRRSLRAGRAYIGISRELGNTCYVQSKLTGGDTDDQLQALGWRVLGPKGSKSKHRVGSQVPRKTKHLGISNRNQSVSIVAVKVANRSIREPVEPREMSG